MLSTIFKRASINNRFYLRSFSTKIPPGVSKDCVQSNVPQNEQATSPVSVVYSSDASTRGIHANYKDAPIDQTKQQTPVAMSTDPSLLKDKNPYGYPENNYEGFEQKMSYQGHPVYQKREDYDPTYTNVLGQWSPPHSPKTYRQHHNHPLFNNQRVITYGHTKMSDNHSSLYGKVKTDSGKVVEYFGDDISPTFYYTPSSNKTVDIPIAAFDTPDTKVTKLPNGMRVASQHTFDDTITVGVWIDAGSRYESEETNGTAHFLEHLAFKGTHKRSRIQIEKETENMGAHLNAYTSREQTVYYAKVFKDDLAYGVDLIADIIQNSKLAKEDIEIERQTILREMEEVEKSYEEVIFDKLHSAAYRDCSLGYTILGPEENIRKINREYCVDYVQKHYTADRMVISCAGPVDHGELVKLVEEKFSSLRPKPISEVRIVKEKPYFCGGELLHKNDDIGPNAHIAVGYETAPWRSADSIALMVLQQVIGSYDKETAKLKGFYSGCRLTNVLAQRGNTYGAAEKYTGFNTHYNDTGMFGVYLVTDEMAAGLALCDVLYQIAQLSHSVTAEEIERAKRQLKTQYFAALDSTTSIAEEIGRQMLVYGRRMSPAEFIARVDKVDPHEARRVAYKYLYDQQPMVAGIGPLWALPRYSTYNRFTFSFLH